MYFLQKHQSGSLHYGIWSARGSPDDFRKEEEFGSVLFPLVNVSSILRNADKDETSCITDLHRRWTIEFTYSIVTRQSARTMISGIPIDTVGILPSEMLKATQLAA